MEAVILWLVIGGVALAIDVLTSAFIFVWFTVGAISSVIAAMLGYGFNVQLISFILVSTAFMVVGYPLVKRTIKSTVVKTPTTEQGYVGRILTVDEDVMDKATIKIDGIYWTVKNEGELIKKGDKVKVTGIEGNKIVIKKLDLNIGEEQKDIE
jgi:membrane protein implicated in regulation of membrane protease activity